MSETLTKQIQDYEQLWPNLDIKHLVLCTNDFIVFIDSELMLDWKTSDEYDTMGHDSLEKHHSILNRAASIECIPNEHQKNTVRLNFKRMLAEGVARSLKHDYGNADSIIDDAENYINNRNIEVARYWQLTTSCTVGLLSAFCILFLWMFRNDLIVSLNIKPFYVLVSAFAGSLGATLSVIFRIGNTTVTSEAEKRLHVLESISRNFGGAISGVIISAFVSLGIIVPIFKSTNMSTAAMVAAGLIAGASERWVPSLVMQFDKGTQAKKGGKLG